MTIALFSVFGGKVHRPADPRKAGERDSAWKPTRTACGIIVNPLNYFETTERANSYLGGRLSEYLCKHCRPD